MRQSGVLYALLGNSPDGTETPTPQTTHQTVPLSGLAAPAETTDERVSHAPAPGSSATAAATATVGPDRDGSEESGGGRGDGQRRLAVAKTGSVVVVRWWLDGGLWDGGGVCVVWGGWAGDGWFVVGVAEA